MHSRSIFTAFSLDQLKLKKSLDVNLSCCPYQSAEIENLIGRLVSERIAKREIGLHEIHRQDVCGGRIQGFYAKAENYTALC